MADRYPLRRYFGGHGSDSEATELRREEATVAPQALADNGKAKAASECTQIGGCVTASGIQSRRTSRLRVVPARTCFASQPASEPAVWRWSLPAAQRIRSGMPSVSPDRLASARVGRAPASLDLY